jgi:hypothetical protein
MRSFLKIIEADTLEIPTSLTLAPATDPIVSLL